jgi:hypothetical protein
MLDQADLPWFAELNRSLLDRLGEAAFRERIRFSTRQMRSLAAEIADRAEGSADTAAIRRLLAEGETFGAVESEAVSILAEGSSVPMPFDDSPAATMLFPRAS